MKRLTLFKIIFTLLIPLAFIILTPEYKVFADDSDIVVYIDVNSFPDSVFREYVKSNIDKDKDDYLSVGEINNVKDINVKNKGISDLKGIEWFSSLNYLNCDDNSISTIDLSGNPDIKNLSCSTNNIAEIDISNYRSLRYLECNDNKLTKLDISGDTNLEMIDCYNNNISDLNLKGLSKLKNLVCYNNNLSELDISDCTLLNRLQCSENPISTLDIGVKEKLDFIECGESDKLTSVNIESAPVLEYFFCVLSSVKCFDISNCPNLSEFICADNPDLESIISIDSKIKYLVCDNSPKLRLDIKDYKSLSHIECDSELLKVLGDLSQLSRIYVSEYYDKPSYYSLAAFNCIKDFDPDKIISITGITKDNFKASYSNGYTDKVEIIEHEYFGSDNRYGFNTEGIRIIYPLTETNDVDFSVYYVNDIPPNDSEAKPQPEDTSDDKKQVDPPQDKDKPKNESPKTDEDITNIKVGDTVEDSKKNKYSVLSLPSGSKVMGTVTYAGINNKKSKKVTIPAQISVSGKSFKVVSVSNNALKNVKTLKEVVIGSNVTKIGNNAFLNCKNLKKVIIKTNKIKKNGFGKNAFKRINNKATFIIPKKQKKNYKKWIKKSGAPKKCIYK